MPQYERQWMPEGMLERMKEAQRNAGTLSDNAKKILRAGVYVEINGETPTIEEYKELQRQRNELLEAVKLTYRKHHLDDDRIGWDELGHILRVALDNTLGVDAVIQWIDEVTEARDR